MKKWLFILTLMMQQTLQLQAQSLMNVDSLLKLLPSAKEDSNAVQLYIDIGQQYENNDLVLAKQYYQMAGRLSKKINYPRGIIKYIVNYTYVLNQQGNFDSSLMLNLQAVEISRQIKDSLYLAKTLFNSGTSYRNMANYEKAIEYYEEGKKLFQRFGNEMITAQAEDIQQILYNDLHQYAKAVQHGEHAVAVLRTLKEPAMLGTALNNLGMGYSSLGNIEKANQIFDEELKISKTIGDKNMEQSAYLNIGNNFLQQGELEKMKPYMEKALAIASEQEFAESEMIALKGLSFYYTLTKKYTTARDYAQKALAISYEHDYKVQREKILLQLANIAYAMQEVQLADQYGAMSNDVGDSILNETIQKNTLDIEKKYETANKEARIKQLEADKQLQQLSLSQKNTFNYILLGSAVTLLIISLLSFRTYKQKQKIQQQRINELETEKKLTATEAVLKGEEQERTRLAKDLHDGLGGMLSGIKYSFANMKGNLILTADNAQAFERSMDMLDSSIKEMRRVAHNLMPEALVKFGLDTALKDFCNGINQTGALQVSYQSIGLENTVIDQTTAIAIYRIIQELINNTMKHAAAKQAIVQISQFNNQLTVTVEDDGNGFDPVILQRAKGIGWSNIQSRIDFMKGSTDIQSAPGKGTSVHIELPV